MTLAEFLENFGVLAEEAGGTEKLRSLILELAVRGRLTHQLPEDEPVETLLTRISTERTPSARRSPLPPDTQEPIFNGTPVFNAPKGWRWVHWGTLTYSTESGWSPRCENRPRTTHEWGVLKVSAVSWNKFKSEENKALPVGVVPDEGYVVREGDFLMSRANTSGLVGRSVVVTENPQKLILSDKIIRCHFSKHIDKMFVNYFNRTSIARAHYIKNASGTSDSMKNISRDVILSVPMPLPPIAEQKRIVAKVDQLMALCDELEARQTKKRETGTRLTQSALDALTNAKGLEEFARAWLRVADHFEVLFDRRESVGELRKSILGIAVRGKLVPQHQDEEPAATLLERIRTITSPKASGRHKGSPDIAKTTNDVAPLFEIPSKWQWAIFTKVASIESCLVDPSEHGDQPHIAPDNIERGTGRLLPYRTIREDKVISSKHQFRAGQLLYSKIRPNLSKAVIVDFEGLCSADMYPISSRINTRYLHLLMLSDVFLGQVVQGDNRLAMPKVNQQQLSATVLPIPPLAEQKRIVAKVDQLMALCDALESKLRDAEQGAQLLAEAMVAEMVA